MTDQEKGTYFTTLRDRHTPAENFALNAETMDFKNTFHTMARVVFQVLNESLYFVASQNSLYYVHMVVSLFSN